MLAHHVYFTLKDHSPAAVSRMLDACRKYLTGHPGSLFFTCGTRALAYDRPVNDQDFHVALTIVFRTAGDHDSYQEAPRHAQFIEENKDNWARVRVFDAEAEDEPMR